MRVKRNSRLPPDWAVYVNETYVSEHEAKAIKFADQLERRAAEMRARNSVGENNPVTVHLIVTPENSVITRALQIMSTRGFSVTGGDKIYTAAGASDFTIRRTRAQRSLR